MEIALAKIAQIVGGTAKGNGDRLIEGAAPFEVATATEITYAEGKKQLKNLAKCDAGAVLAPMDTDQLAIDTIFVANPKLAFATVLRLFYPRTRPETGISDDAHIGDNFRCGVDVSIAPMVYLGKDVCLGDRVILHPGVVIGDEVSLGDDVEIYPNVTILAGCIIGSRVMIHAGTVIGSDGFGFIPDGGAYHKMPHRGIVRIGDDVEIGANNTIDRATFGETWIKDGVKTDNLVQIAHNVTIGENSVVVAQVGISGSTTIGKNNILAGQAGIAGHLTLADNVIIGPQTGVPKSINESGAYAGVPALPFRKIMRVQRVWAMLPELKKRIETLEKELVQITSASASEIGQTGSEKEEK
jgi:UDP-3-O-[3-hydroxymyristoyl] glucosamine N-acyltransferase